MILLGEVHGTKEIPLLFAQVVDQLSEHKPIFLCLEMPRKNQPFIDKFVEKKEERLLRAIPFFRAPFEDGRNSREMFTFLEKVAGMKNVSIVCIDTNTYTTQNAREKYMADRIAELAANGRKIIALLGNTHTARKQITLGDETIEPTGFVLSKEFGTKLYCIAIQPSSGTLYNFGRKNVSGMIPKDKYDQVIDIGRVTPAKPCGQVRMRPLSPRGD